MFGPLREAMQRSVQFLAEDVAFGSTGSVGPGVAGGFRKISADRERASLLPEEHGNRREGRD